MQLLVLSVAVATLAWVAIEHLHLSRAVRRRPPPPLVPKRWPSLTVVRPVKGLDVGAAENVRALLDSDYPGRVQILFVFDDAQDPAVPVVDALVNDWLAGHEHADVRLLFAGRPPEGRTGKLHAMALGVAEATGELIAFSDSDTRLDRDLLTALVERLLSTPHAGDVFAPAIADTPAHTAGDAGYALMLNAWYGAVAAAAAGPARDLPFIMGQLMIFRREALARIGGVEAADGQLVDDMYLGQRVAAAGLLNVMSRRRLHVVNEELGARAFLRLMRRWVLFSRSGLPPAMKWPGYLRGAAIWIALLAAIAGAVAGWPVTFLVAAAALALICWSDRRLHVALGGAPIPLRLAWVTIGIAVVAPFVVASMLADHHVDWRGRDYTLDGEARLGSRAAR